MMAVPAELEEEMFNVAMVSCNFDEKVARVVSKAMYKVGKEGTINLGESPSGET